MIGVFLRKEILKHLQLQEIATQILLVLLPFSFYAGRAILSINIIALFILGLCCLFINPPKIKVGQISLYASAALLSIIPAISLLWSAQISDYQSIAHKTAIPVILWGFLFIRNWWHSKMIDAFIFFTFMGIGYSIYLFISNYSTITANYQYAKVLPTPLGSQHISFSLAVASSVFLLLHKLYIEQFSTAQQKFWLRITLIATGIIYLHVLASKTGLLLFYLGSLITCIYFIAQPNYRKKATLIAIVFAMAITALYFTIPTFKARIQYVQYEWKRIVNNNYDYTYSDASRMISIKIGVAHFTKNVLYGVGYGNITNTMKIDYKKDYPKIQETEQWPPLSQWVLYAMGMGIVGLITLAIFTIIVAIQLYKAKNFIALLLLFWLPLFFCFEIPLESQYGASLIAIILGFALHLPSKKYLEEFKLTV
jgi:O-antigen ligase